MLARSCQQPAGTQPPPTIAAVRPSIPAHALLYTALHPCIPRVRLFYTDIGPPIVVAFHYSRTAVNANRRTAGIVHPGGPAAQLDDQPSQRSPRNDRQSSCLGTFVAM